MPKRPDRQPSATPGQPEILADYRPEAPVGAPVPGGPRLFVTEPEILADYRLQAPVRSPDQTIADLAARQHGRVARWQLLRMGLTNREIRQRLERGTMHRILHGVYAVGHTVGTLRARSMEGVLAAGPGAVLSHEPAGAVHGIRPFAGRPVVTVGADRRPRPGFVYHQSSLRPDEVTHVDGIPITTVPRTLLDLAAVLPPRQIARALHEAEVLRLYDALSLVDMLRRYPGRRGVAAIRQVLADRGEYGAACNDFEDDFDAFLEAEGLPRPAKNVALVVGEWVYVVDCVWNQHGVVAELDGRASHDTRNGFESDRLRDRRLTIAGWRPIRITWRQLYRDQAALAADLHALLR